MRRGVRDQVGDRIAQQQTQQGHRTAHHQRPEQQGDVDAEFFRLLDDGSVGTPPEIEGSQVVAEGEALAGGADRPPGSGLSPRRVPADEGVPGGCRGRFRGRPGAAHDHAPHPARDPVHPAAEPSGHSGFERGLEFPGGGREHRFPGEILSIPVLQQGERFRQGVRDHRVMDAAGEHRPEREEEGNAHEGDERQGQPGRAQPGPCGWRHSRFLRHRASQALKRSCTSSRWSLHQSASLVSIRPRCSGLVGRCGSMGTPVSRWVVTSGSAERRVGL